MPEFECLEKLYHEHFVEMAKDLVKGQQMGAPLKRLSVAEINMIEKSIGGLTEGQKPDISSLFDQSISMSNVK
jgi:hypothetical protein